MTAAVVCAPLRSERAALLGRTSVTVVRTGRGPRHRLRVPADAIAIVGVAGATDAQLRPGDLVVARELRRAGAVFPCPAAPLLHAALLRLGLPARLGPIFSADRVVGGAARERVAVTGAIAVDTESAFLAGTVPAGRAVAVRAIVDTPSAPLLRAGTMWRGIQALRALRAAAPVLDQWAAAQGDREVLLTRPDTSAGSTDPTPELVLALGDSDPVPTTTTPSHRIADAGAIDLRWLAGVRRITVTVPPTVPADAADPLVEALSGLGRVRVHHSAVFTDTLRFTLGR